MQEQKRRIPVGIVVGLSAAMVAAGSATAYFTWQQSQNKPTPNAAIEQAQPTPSASPLPPPAVTSPNQASPNPQAASEKAARAYWLEDRGAEIQLTAAPVKVQENVKPEVALTTAINAVLGSPPDKNMASAIPPGTQLRSLQVQPDGVRVDLSKSFTTGGGSLSMSTRLAQVLYTATSLDPKTPVFLSVEGKTLKTLGGEGLIVDQPLTRTSFEQAFGQSVE
ncbi:GerMN domain-containing protein [Myxacorys almedinensis]|uniref:Spore germination protein n=1 Tax=Myxacorys almedinensis A TaxID=2690445 RepID=A0A8J7YXS1_9CYAN|nr:GerMN domain-containing protein [Myxacorys almedinensis]NDJ16074.1 spore germination protein [Myxacorys almedinensis A]